MVRGIPDSGPVVQLLNLSLPRYQSGLRIITFTYIVYAPFCSQSVLGLIPSPRPGPIVQLLDWSLSGASPGPVLYLAHGPFYPESVVYLIPSPRSGRIPHS